MIDLQPRGDEVVDLSSGKSSGEESGDVVSEPTGRGTKRLHDDEDEDDANETATGRKREATTRGATRTPALVPRLCVSAIGIPRKLLTC